MFHYMYGNKFALKAPASEQSELLSKPGVEYSEGMFMTSKLSPELTRWTPCPMEYPYLYVDLVPKSTWYSNLRKVMTEDQWGRVRRFVYKRAGHVCEICGGTGPKWPVEAHERWVFESGVQKLVGVQALCPDCHQVTHYGLAEMQGYGEKAIKHLMKVNGWKRKKAEKHIQKQFVLWNERSTQDWKLDISHIQDAFYRELTGKEVEEIMAKAKS